MKVSFYSVHVQTCFLTEPPAAVKGKLLINIKTLIEADQGSLTQHVSLSSFYGNEWWH